MDCQYIDKQFTNLNHVDRTIIGGDMNKYEINPGFETGPNGHRTLVCTPKLDKYLKMP
jgi:hypothetical protein